MKRLIILLMVCLLVIPAAGAEGENVLLSHAVELGRELDAIAEDEEYFGQYTSNDEALAMIRTYGGGSHDAPSEIRAVELDGMRALIPADVEELPDAGKRQMTNQLPGIVMQSFINSCGVNQVVVSTILRARETFAAPEVSGQGLWVMDYEDAASIGVAWYAENGAVHMEAAFLPADIQLSTELPISTRVVAAARLVLDEYALSLAEELRSLTQSETYLNMLGLSPEILAAVRSFTSGADSAPRLTLCALTDDYDAVNARLVQEIGYLSDIQLAAAGSMRATVIFADEDATGTGLYLFLYEDCVPIIVQWRGENGAYHLTAFFQPGENPHACQSAEDASAWAESLGLQLRFQPLGAMLLP